MPENRKLSTIIFADIAGYTALMQDDEEKALKFLSGFKKTVEAETSRFEGRVVQYFGDACLLSFESSTKALNCAIELQFGLRRENIPVRIGIHLGEVVYTENNAFGDGVNIASRIESLGISGAILMSRPVRDQVKNKPEFQLVSVGNFDFKNVKEPMEVFALANPGIVVPRRNQMKGKLQPGAKKKIPVLLALLIIIVVLTGSGLFVYFQYFMGNNPDKNKIDKSIAVLPFHNDSPDEENVYFCNGIMEGVLDNLAKIPGLSVVSRTSVEQYRENPPSTTEIAKQLGVNYILEGSVLRVGNRSIIRAQLIYAPEDRHLWSDQYDKQLEDIFSVLTEVTQNIAENLKATISPKVLKNIEYEPTGDLTAYDYYLQGKEYFNNYELGGHEEDIKEADRLFRIAIERDSTFARAYVGRASVLTAQHQFEFYDNEDLVDSVIDLCNKAISIDPSSADAYWIRGSFYDDFLFDIPKAEADLNKALEINPNHVGAIRQMSFLIRYHHGDVIGAIKLMKILEKIDRSVKELGSTYGIYASLYMDIGYWEKCQFYLDKAIELNPGYKYFKAWLFALHGKTQEAIQLISPEDYESQGRLVTLGMYYTLEKNYEKALEYYQEWATKVKNEGAESSSGVKDWHRYGQVLVAVGRIEEGTQLMNNQLKLNEKLLSNFQMAHKVLYDNAGIYAYLGKKKQAYEFLRKFDETNRWEDYIYFIQIDPLFDNLRGEKDFEAIVNKQLEKNRQIRAEIDRLETAGEI